MASPLLINIAELLRRPGTEREVDVEVPLADLELTDARFPTGGDVGVDLHLDSMPDGIVVTGHLAVPWVGQCRRCLSDTAGTSPVEVHELYQADPPSDPDAFPIEGEQIDLRPLVREAALIEAPSTPLCRPDCAGLCPTCGIDRNVATCDCVAAPTDDRWSALDQLRGRLPE